MTKRNDAASLARPGAGIPVIERWMANLGVRAYARLAGKDRILKLFRQEAKQALQIAAALSPEQGQRQVVIRRIGGIEDSSRNWSVYMVLEHLVIVNRGIMHLQQVLCEGQSGLPEVRIEDVKPHAAASAELLQRFRETVEAYTRAVERRADLHSAAKHAHPWFGPLDAHEWHALAAVHCGLHRRQIKRVARAVQAV